MSKQEHITKVYVCHGIGIFHEGRPHRGRDLVN